MTDWIDSGEALARLRVKQQTLYAYVSRGLVEARADPADPRRRLYRALDIDALGGRRTRSRKRAAIAAGSMAWGEPSIVTGIATVHRARLVYRGRDAVELAEAGASLEAVAALLWDSGPVAFITERPPHADPFAALAALASGAGAGVGRGTARLARDAQEAIGAIARSCGVAPGDTPLHERLAALWSCDEGGADILRRALVLVADHDLNVSTFATRVAASSGASLAASLLAGLCALSGPRHGGASAALARLLDACAAQGTGAAVEAWLDAHGALPGFGHPLYPDGDARAHALLPLLPDDPEMAALAAHVLDVTGKRPNVDFALVAVARALALPPGASFTLFLLGRSVGWAAHAMEQGRERTLIRPRARYEGPLPAE